VFGMACVWRVAIAAIALLSYGCGGGSGGVLSVPGGCATNDATLGFPAVAGFTASAHIRGQDCLDASNFQTRSGTSPVVGEPFTSAFNGDPAGTVWLYVAYEFDGGEILASSPDLTFTVPASVLVPGRAFHVAVFDPASPFWFTGFYGAPVSQGTTLTFAGDGQPATIDAKATYQYALYSTGT
jgi:hypothetical protein